MKEFARIFVPRFALAILLSLGFALSCAVAHGRSADGARGLGRLRHAARGPAAREGRRRTAASSASSRRERA